MTKPCGCGVYDYADWRGQPWRDIVLCAEHGGPVRKTGQILILSGG